MKRAPLKPEMKFGAEPKKLAMLGGTLAVLAVVYFMNRSDTPSSSPAPTPAAVNRPAAPAASTSTTTRVPTRQATRASGRGGSQGRNNVTLQEFRPTLRPKDPIDPSRVDPTLKLDLLDKLQDVTVEGGGRSLFDFAKEPEKKVEIAAVKPIIPGENKVAFIGPIKPKDPEAAPKPPPAPIPLKFYGSDTLKQGPKRAFFMEGEDIFVAAEGELIKNRYKVVRIGVNSAVVEDTTNKNQQTLPLIAADQAS